jgi:SPX domain protein involved in polyphosphate accumulation
MIRYRYEKKYLVPNEKLPSLRKRFLPFLEPDTYSQVKNGIPEYTVRSIYFDSRDSMSFHEKIEGLRERKKIRVRGYGTLEADSKVVLEIKRKVDDRIYKNRAFIPHASIEKVLSRSEFTGLSLEADKIDENLSRFMFNVKYYCLLPKNLIVYDREAYHGRFNSGVRVTFDKKIRQRKTDSLNSLFFEKGLKQVWHNTFILEIKYFEQHMPTWAKSIVEEFQLRPEALSKYTNSVENSLLF